MKELQKEIKGFKKLKANVERTKQYQEEGNSSGSEGYKLQQKYRNYSYIRQPKMRNGSVYTSSKESCNEGLQKLQQLGVDMEQPKYSLKRQQVRDFDRQEEEERLRLLQEQKKDKARAMWAKVRKFVGLITKGSFQDADDPMLGLDFSKPHLRK